jgi:serine/threonine-protein kinase HipA
MQRRERRFLVMLHERKVGVLHAHDDYTRFSLDTVYTQDPDRAVLGLRFEQDLSVQHTSNVRLPPWFSNLLPEGRLRQWIAEARGVSEAREMELLAEVGHDLPGAVLVVEDSGPLSVPLKSERNVGAEDQRAPSSEGLWRFSLAGVALKFSMLQKGDRFTAPGVGEGGDWIVKLPDQRHRQVPLNEYAMMRLAGLAGLEIPEVRLVHRDELEAVPSHLWPPGEDQAYAIRRFDRLADRRRVHVEDLAQVRGFYSDAKYRGTFETVGALIYRQRDVRSLVEFSKRLALNVLIGNGDAHLKNWSLLYEDPRVPRLSPAYDLVATAVYRPPDHPEDLGLKFGGFRRFDTVTLDTFQRLQDRLGVRGISLSDEVRSFVENVGRAWPQIADLIKVEPFLLEGIGNGLAHRMRTILRS